MPAGTELPPLNGESYFASKFGTFPINCVTNSVPPVFKQRPYGVALSFSNVICNH